MQGDEDKAKAVVGAAGGGGAGWKLPELQDSSQLRCTRLPDPQTPSKVRAGGGPIPVRLSKAERGCYHLRQKQSKHSTDAAIWILPRSSPF